MYFGGAQPSKAPLVFPEFPLPPGESSASDNTRPLLSGNYVAGDMPQPAAGGPAAFSGAAALPPATVGGGGAGGQREDCADEVIRATAEHWVHEQLSRHLMQQVAGTEVGELLGEEEKAAGRGNEVCKGRLEFFTGSPNYFCRVILLLAVGFFGAIPLMSSFAFTVLITGCVLTYAADIAGYRRGCVVSIICTTFFFGVALFLSNIHAFFFSVGSLCMGVSLVGLLVLLDMAAFLHFHWIQLSFPELICLMERCVLGVTPILTLPSLLATVTALVGSRHASAWFMLFMCVIHHYFYEPLESSFLRQLRVVGEARQTENNSSKDEASEEVAPIRVNGVVEARAFTLLLLILPVVIYVSFQNNYIDAWLPNTVNTVGLFFGPIAYLCLNPNKSLWFMLPEKMTLQHRLQFDPFGIHDFISVYRKLFFILSGAVVMHWFIYRLLHSRYGYLFNGIPPPLNGFCLALAMYLGLYAVYQLKTLLDADKRGEDLYSYHYMKIRSLLIAAAALTCIFVGVASNLPGVFIFLMVLSVSSFNLFLLDRLNPGPMLSFTVFSSMLLLWWMFRMFSFIVLDLHVFGEAATISTPVVTMSVLWCYVLSCITFTLSFSTNRFPFLISLFAHSLQVAWIEHVLYSQREENVYPAILVPFTTAVGVLLASQLYKNEKLEVSEASFIAASYIAKLVTFLVELMGSYYLAEANETEYGSYREFEIAASWWSALFAGYVVVLFEIERRRQLRNKHTRLFTLLYIISIFVMTLCTIRNFQRAVYEFFTQSRLAAGNNIHVALGTSFVFFGVVTYPFFSRHAVVYTFLSHLKVLSRGALVVGIIFLIAQPTRIYEHEDAFEFDFVVENVSSYCSLVGLLLLVFGQLVPMTALHLVFRVLYWMIVTITFSVGISMYILPIPVFYLFSGVCGFVFFSLMTLDVTHYRKMSSHESWIIYIVSVCFMLFSLTVMGRIDVREYVSDNPLLIWDIYTRGRTRMLCVSCVTSLFIAILLRFRLSGKSLLHGALPLTSDVVYQAGTVVNCSTIVFIFALTTLNIWRNGNEPGLHVASSFFLLLLVDDGVIFFRLSQGYFRYFPVLTYAISALWISLFQELFASGLSITSGILQCVWCLLYALPVVPSHVSLLLVTWFGQRRGGTSFFLTVIFVVLGVFCLLLSSRKTIQWMAIVGICGQIVRLFETRSFKRQLEAVL